MSEPIEPMDPSLRDSLRRALEPMPAPSAARERVGARLDAAIAASLGAAASTPAATPRAAGPAPTARQVASNSGAAGQGALAAGTAKVTLLVLLGFAVGGVAGAAATRAFTAPVERLVVVHDTATAPQPAPNASAGPVEEPTLAPEPVASHASALPSTTPSASGTTSERAILDDARTAFARGDTEASLRTLERHRTRFPNGTLAEEREALAIRALAGLGRTSEAKERADAFLARYPQSLMGPAVEAAVGTGR